MLCNLQVRERKTYPAAAVASALLAVLSVCGTSLGAQQQGPLPTPSIASAPQSKPDAAATTPAPATTSQGATSTISNQPPALPVDQIIQRFAAREAEFKKERDNYTYTQTFVIQTIDGDGMADGEYQMRSDILFTPDGKRYEKVTYAPASTLARIQMSQQDLDDLERGQLFGFTGHAFINYG